MIESGMRIRWLRTAVTGDGGQRPMTTVTEDKSQIFMPVVMKDGGQRLMTTVTGDKSQMTMTAVTENRVSTAHDGCHRGQGMTGVTCYIS